MRQNVVLPLLALLFCWLTMPQEALALDVPDKYRDGVTIVHAETMEPLSFVGYNGEPKGIVADFWRKWSEKTGVPVIFKLTSWKEGLEMIRSGQCDIHGGLFLTDERIGYMDFSDGYLPIKTALMVPRGSVIKSMDDLPGYRVGVLDKGASQEYMELRYPEVEIAPYKNVRLAVKALNGGDVDALYMDYPTVMYISGTMGTVKELLPVEFVTERPLRAAVAKGNRELMKLVEDGLASIAPRERERIMAQWFIEPHPETFAWMYVLAGAVVLMLGVLYVLFFGFPFRAGR